ncbi:Hypothetical predicted protein [Pelobates cultripes]|uniref:Uncharacterized protein n=1 Tax=Pelobates cultripes TaxID=61616 RepID=A0AAD1RLV0_PELCU|nr:Hypothetical predicted protein [Pelobates cultripes]
MAVNNLATGKTKFLMAFDNIFQRLWWRGVSDLLHPLPRRNHQAELWLDSPLPCGGQRGSKYRPADLARG